MTRISFRALAPASLLFIVLPTVFAQPDGPPTGDARARMWFAPTAADWQKPCLIPWQRSWEDAVALSKATKRPILVCVNMDGEIASEHYAGVRYRQPEIAKIYEPYVTVIASVYRHTPRDHDEHGHRIPCPRFGTVTCGEHIALEPLVFEKFLDGRRIAPRHIMVELDGSEVYDVFYAFDTASVFQAIGDGIAKRTIQPVPIVKGDRPLLERVASPDAADRAAVEAAYRDGDQATRRALLEASLAQGSTPPVEVLRLSINGFDPELAKLGRQALAQSASESAVELIGEALRVPVSDPERDALLAALDRLGAESPRARTLASVQRGLTSEASVVDANTWAASLSRAYVPASEAILASRLDRMNEVASSSDPSARLDLAEAFLQRALETEAGPGDDRRTLLALLEDARTTAQKAETLGATGYRIDSLLAVVSYHLGDYPEAQKRAEAAMKQRPTDTAASPNAALVLALFGEARHRDIVAAIEAKKRWPGQWLTDMHTAHSLLLKHPEGTESTAISHYDFLEWVGAFRQATRFLDEALARFPESETLHERFRQRAIRRQGVDGMDAAYAVLVAQSNAPKSHRWFAGYASIVAAEFHRRGRNATAAMAAYDRAIAYYDEVSTATELKVTADHYAAMALGGKARVFLEEGALDRCLDTLCASFTRRADAAASLDGLNFSAVDTAKMLRPRLVDAQQDALVSRLDAALASLDPKMLELPAFERETPPQPAPGATPRPNRPGRGR